MGCFNLSSVLVCLLVVASEQSLAGAFATDSATVPRDSLAHVRVGGRIMVATSGLAPIPAFSFNNPVVLASAWVGTRRVRYEPDIFWGLNGKPWIINHWFRVVAIDQRKLKIKAGINPSLFFKNDELPSGETILHAQRNFNVQLDVEQRLSQTITLFITYLHNTACDRGALSGHFFNLGTSLPTLTLHHTISLTLKPQLFYFNFDGATDGLFASGVLRISHKSMPLVLQAQGVLPLWANFSDAQGKGNVGVCYEF